MRSVLARVTGQVQGVGFRFWTADQAARYGLSGWVRNMSDGSVRALFCGPDEAVEAMLRDCAQGPPAARVRSVTTEAAAPPAEDGFRVLR